MRDISRVFEVSEKVVDFCKDRKKLIYLFLHIGTEIIYSEFLSLMQYKNDSEDHNDLDVVMMIILKRVI